MVPVVPVVRRAVVLGSGAAGGGVADVPVIVILPVATGRTCGADRTGRTDGAGRPWCAQSDQPVSVRAMVGVDIVARPVNTGGARLVPVVPDVGRMQLRLVVDRRAGGGSST